MRKSTKLEKTATIAEVYEYVFARVLVDEARGIVYWGARPKTDFSDSRGYNTWNTLHRGQEIGYRNGTRSGLGFKFNGRNLSVSRLIGRKLWGKKVYTGYIGYVDGNPNNLRGANLYLLKKWADRKINHPDRNKHGHRGVSYRGGKFESYRVINNVKTYLGRFNTAAEAGAAYERAAP